LAWRGKICSSHSNLLRICQMGVAQWCFEWINQVN
jgi:hypothetical protein